MSIMHFVGLDVHKKTVAYCVKRQDGEVVESGSIPATRRDLGEWARGVPVERYSGRPLPKAGPYSRRIHRILALALRPATEEARPASWRGS